MPARCRRSCARVKGWYEVLLIGLRGRSWRGTGKGYRPLSVAPDGDVKDFGVYLRVSAENAGKSAEAPWRLAQLWRDSRDGYPNFRPRPHGWDLRLSDSKTRRSRFLCLPTPP